MPPQCQLPETLFIKKQHHAPLQLSQVLGLQRAEDNLASVKDGEMDLAIVKKRERDLAIVKEKERDFLRPVSATHQIRSQSQG